MVQEEQLSAVLSEFASTLVTDFPIQGILDHLVRRIHRVLPVTSAGVILMAPGSQPRYIAASDSSALRFEALQTEVGEGPCLLAYESGEAVAVPDLSTDDRFPIFGPRAVEAGLAAVFTFPLRQDGTGLGALDLYCDTPGLLSARDMTAAQTLADVASAYLTNARARAAANEVSDQYRKSASYDLLTGLPNRLLLSQRLEHAAQRGQRSRTDAAVLFADLDRFKLVNDTYGHQIGDGLLIAVAERLEALLRPGDTLARVSGDEFVILCEDLQDASDVEALANRIDDAFAQPFHVADTQLSITASVGMAFAGHGENLSEQIINDADIAMYQAKRKGGGSHQLIDLREANTSSEWRQLDRDLRAAVADDDFEVHYQPVVRTTGGIMVGVEALLRWYQNGQRSIPPETVVALAENSGLIASIGARVLQQACQDRRLWLEQNPHVQMQIAVNISTTQLMAPGFCKTVASILKDTGTEPAAVVLEMTEKIFIPAGDRAGLVLLSLKDLGVGVALDDFGTGYSSLSYLRRFPVSGLKIDKSFLDFGNGPDDMLMFGAITDLAHALRLVVTAEGVETRRQLDVVAAAGCEYSQGFYFAHPLPANAIAGILRDAAGGPLAFPMATST